VGVPLVHEWHGSQGRWIARAVVTLYAV
jgi:hypothetical protein